ncbi:MAG TPA: hypothetical protein QF753_04890 [Victivallales bacterium]|nr:hypothetical protein [Victivallales bacterium]
MNTIKKYILIIISLTMIAVWEMKAGWLLGLNSPRNTADMGQVIKQFNPYQGYESFWEKSQKGIQIGKYNFRIDKQVGPWAGTPFIITDTSTGRVFSLWSYIDKVVDTTNKRTWTVAYDNADPKMPYSVYFTDKDGGIKRVLFDPKRFLDGYVRLEDIIDDKTLHIDIYGSESDFGVTTNIGRVVALWRIPGLGLGSFTDDALKEAHDSDGVVAIFKGTVMEFVGNGKPDRVTPVYYIGEVDGKTNTVHINRMNYIKLPNNDNSQRSWRYSWTPLIGKGGKYLIAACMEDYIFEFPVVKSNIVKNRLTLDAKKYYKGAGPEDDKVGTAPYKNGFVYTETVPYKNESKARQELWYKSAANEHVSFLNNYGVYDWTRERLNFHDQGEVYDFDNVEDEATKRGFIVAGLILSLPPNPYYTAEKKQPKPGPKTAFETDEKITHSRVNSETHGVSGSAGFSIDFKVFKLGAKNETGKEWTEDEIVIDSSSQTGAASMKLPIYNMWVGTQPLFRVVRVMLTGPDGETVLQDKREPSSEDLQLMVVILAKGSGRTEYRNQVLHPEEGNISKGMDKYWPGSIDSKGNDSGLGWEDLRDKMKVIQDISTSKITDEEYKGIVTLMNFDTSHMLKNSVEKQIDLKIANTEAYGNKSKFTMQFEGNFEVKGVGGGGGKYKYESSTSSSKEKVETNKWTVNSMWEGRQPSGKYKYLQCIPTLYYVDMTELKKNFSRNSKKTNKEIRDTWFISDYVWDNNQSFWVLGYSDISTETQGL